MTRKMATIIFVLALAALVFNATPLKGADSDAKLLLKQGWAVQSSAEVIANGRVISTSGFDQTNWYETSVPSTVLAALIGNGLYADPFFGMNFKSIPGSLPTGMDTSASRMPPGSPFRDSWW